METTTIRDYMTPAPETIGVDQTLTMARDRMRAAHIRHLPVLEGGRLVGLLSDRDLNWIESLEDVDAQRTSIREAMTPEPFVVSPSTPLREVALTMAAGKYGSTLVVENGRVCGVFTTVDAMRALAEALGAPSAVEG